MTEQNQVAAAEPVKAGVSELKDVLAFGLALGMSVDQSLADDGKISLADLPKFLTAFMKAPSAFTGADKLGGELRDLDAAERQELQDFVKAEFHIANEKLEEVVEEALAAALSVARVVAILKA